MRSHSLKLVAWLAVVLGTGGAGAVSAQVASPHNLLTAGAEAEQVCVFCHVPSGGTRAVQQPSWVAESDPNGSSYNTIDTLNSSIDLASSALGATSLVCMTCHDGSQAPIIAAKAGRMDDTHPSGVIYAGTQASAVVGSERRRVPGSSFTPPDSAVIRGRTVWWIETGSGLGRQKQDLFLGSRSDGMPYVECATCHDPHGTSNPALLRVTPDRDRLCKSCHQY